MLRLHMIQRHCSRNTDTRHGVCGWRAAGCSACHRTDAGWLSLDGTNAGLFRFDGVRFVPLLPANGARLTSPEIVSLLGTRDGSLWIGTTAGLAHWSRNRLTEIPGTRGSIVSILEDEEGGYGSRGRGRTIPTSADRCAASAPHSMSSASVRRAGFPFGSQRQRHRRAAPTAISGSAAATSCCGGTHAGARRRSDGATHSRVLTHRDCGSLSRPSGPPTRWVTANNRVARYPAGADVMCTYVPPALLSHPLQLLRAGMSSNEMVLMTGSQPS